MKHEVHITGSHDIIDVAKQFKIKTISVDLLKPDYSLLRTEYMTSFHHKCTSFEECKKYVDDLTAEFIIQSVSVARLKIESPPYDHYFDRAKYVEAHFPAVNNIFPISANQKRPTEYLATDRRYNKSIFRGFADYYKKSQVELCLQDTNVKEDWDWMTLYN